MTDTAITANLVLVPTLVVLGSFLAQVTCTRHLSVWSAEDGAILGAVLFSTAVRTGSSRFRAGRASS